MLCRTRMPSQMMKLLKNARKLLSVAVSVVTGLLSVLESCRAFNYPHHHHHHHPHLITGTRHTEHGNSPRNSWLHSFKYSNIDIYHSLLSPDYISPASDLLQRQDMRTS